MTFVYVPRNGLGSAVDRESGVTIREELRPWSDTDPILHGYVYEAHEIRFSFGAASHEEIRIVTGKKDPIERSVCVGVDIFEPSVTGALERLNKGAIPVMVNIEKIKAEIIEAVYTLCVGGGFSPTLSKSDVKFVSEVGR